MKVYDRILSTATTLFHTQGYNATGINQIIEVAKVAKGSFYYNFKSKEAVCIAYLNSRHDFWFQQLQLYVGKEEKPSEKILSVFDFLMEMNKKENFRGCSFLNTLSEISSDNTSILGVIQNHKKELKVFIKSLITNEQIADHAYLLFESAIIESQIFKNQEPVKTAKKIVKSLMVK